MSGTVAIHLDIVAATNYPMNLTVVSYTIWECNSLDNSKSKSFLETKSDWS